MFALPMDNEEIFLDVLMIKHDDGWPKRMIQTEMDVGCSRVIWDSFLVLYA